MRVNLMQMIGGRKEHWISDAICLQKLGNPTEKNSQNKSQSRSC